MKQFVERDRQIANVFSGGVENGVGDYFRFLYLADVHFLTDPNKLKGVTRAVVSVSNKHDVRQNLRRQINRSDDFVRLQIAVNWGR